MWYKNERDEKNFWPSTGKLDHPPAWGGLCEGNEDGSLIKDPQ